MQVDHVAWTTAGRGLAARAMRPYGRRDTFGDALTRCQRCDIPLGSQLCPNPECREPHGARLGDLCAWCYDNLEERIDAIDSTSSPSMEWAVLSCASVHVD